MLTRILARITGQDLRDELARVHAQQGQILHLLVIQGDSLRQARHHLTHLETIVSELDSSTDELIAAVNDLLAQFDPTTQAELLRQLAEKNEQIADLQADDAADAAQILDLTDQRDQLVADLQENVGKQVEATARIRAVVPAAQVPTDPPAEPVTDLESAPVDATGGNA